MKIQPKYKAFISYSHADKKQVEQLLHRLETYKLPKRLLKEQETQIIQDNGRLGAFFRDREELSVGDLTAQIKSALAEAEYLIVVCSPNSAQSHWVSEEILAFKRLHGEDKVLAVIIAGDDDLEQVFPKPLRFLLGEDGALSETGTEPLAADFRTDKDGPRLGFLKLVATLAQTDLSKLLDRDQQRRQRKVMISTGVFAAAAVAMGGLTKFAFDQRTYATTQQAEAEGLVEFMLTDLTRVLEPIGKLDILSSVGERVEGYYERQPLNRMSSNSIMRRAKAFHQLGAIEQQRGRHAPAQKHFDAALAATKSEYDKNPNDPDIIFEYSQNAFYQGENALKIGDYATTEKSWLLYQELSHKLLSMDPESEKYQLEVAWAALNMGIVYMSGFNLRIEEAHQQLQEAKSRFDDLIERSPDNLVYLVEAANVSEWLADLEHYTPNLLAAIQLRLEQDVIYTKILKIAPENYNFSLDRLQNKNALARLYLETLEDDKALKISKEVSIGSQKLTLIEPENIQSLFAAAFAYNTAANVLLNADQVNKETVYENYNKSKMYIDSMAELVQVDSNDFALLNSSRVLSYALGAKIEMAKDDYRAAIQFLDQIIAFEKKAESGNADQYLRAQIHRAYTTKLECRLLLGEEVSQSEIDEIREMIKSVSNPLSISAIKNLHKLEELNGSDAAIIEALSQKIIQAGAVAYE